MAPGPQYEWALPVKLEKLLGVLSAAQRRDAASFKGLPVPAAFGKPGSGGQHPREQHALRGRSGLGLWWLRLCSLEGEIEVKDLHSSSQPWRAGAPG